MVHVCKSSDNALERWLLGAFMSICIISDHINYATVSFLGCHFHFILKFICLTK